MNAGGLIEEYGSIRPQYEAFTTSLEALLRTLLAAAEIEFFAIEPRTKTVQSFKGKIEREDKSGKYKAVSDITDLSGVRIIAYLQEDCNAIERLVKENFTIDDKNSVKKEEELDPDKFGYLSTHYVASLGEDRLKLLEFARFGGMKAEVQIRTLLQHTWAAIDWKFRYKEEREAPKGLRRRLFRISALLEAADNEFSAVKTEIDELRRAYAEEITKGDLDIPLNSESILSFIKTSPTAQAVFEVAKRAGYTILKSTPSSKFQSGFVGTAELAGIRTLNQLDAALNGLLPTLGEFFSYLSVERGDKATNPPQLVETAILRYPLLLTTAPAKRKTVYSRHQPPPGYAEAIEKYLKRDKARQGTSRSAGRRGAEVPTSTSRSKVK
jgi:ppGpp synthetase/RelA/SpoT-type nucleotidyltranferase